MSGYKKSRFCKTDEVVSFHTACIKDSKENDLFLFLEYYGGNAGPEDLYGVFDPRSQKILIRPMNIDKGNSEDVKKLLGYLPPSGPHMELSPDLKLMQMERLKQMLMVFFVVSL